MSTRWMAVQYVGDTLRLPVVNEGDMDKPFGSSVLERDVKRIVVNPFSDSPQRFVPELESDKLRELVSQLIYCAERVGNEDIFYYQPTRDGCGFDCVANGEHCSFAKMCDRARELGVEV